MLSFALRFYSRIKRELRNIGVSEKFQSFEYRISNQKQNEISILIVAAGSVRIPTHEWGAVETIIAETIPVYLKNGISVGLLNTDNWLEWRRARKYSYDVLICHSDTHLRKVRKAWPQTKLVAVTHYGLASRPTLWHPSYKRVFKSIALADKIVCLSPAIHRTFSRLIPQEKLVLIGNGTAFESKPLLTKTESIVVVGKVEERKRQYEMSLFANESGMSVDFFGPIQDPRVLATMEKDSRLRKHFKGTKNRIELGAELPRYRAIALLSEGEADALVLYEAQIAGVEIITNADSLGSQNPDLPWVHVVEDFEDLKRVAAQISRNPINPIEISDYAESQYRWDVRLQPLIGLVRDLASNEE